MQEDFDEAVKAGTMTAREHERALKDLELGYKDIRQRKRMEGLEKICHYIQMEFSRKEYRKNKTPMSRT